MKEGYRIQSLAATDIEFKIHFEKGIFPSNSQRDSTPLSIDQHCIPDFNPKLFDTKDLSDDKIIKKLQL